MYEEENKGAVPKREFCDIGNHTVDQDDYLPTAEMCIDCCNDIADKEH